MSLLSSEPFNLTKTFDAVDAAIDANADISEAILETGLAAYGIDPESKEWKGAATPGDMDKARSTIRQFWRDWSGEGGAERRACSDPIINALNSTFSHLAPAQRSRISVLVPGAGLGRLAFEINRAGYTVEGNEISYHQLFASNWILNCTKAAKSHALYPWALSFSNHTKRAHQLEKVLIPDLLPSLALSEASEALQSHVHAYERMSMSSGDFCVLYKGPEYRGAFNAVATCFFIDTAPNLISYIETVRHCLAPGGIWVNVGPLLWHFEGGQQPANSKASGREKPQEANQGIGEAGSFELADEEIIQLLQHFQFDVIEHNPMGIEVGYIQDPNNMLQNIYRPSMWTVRKSG